MIANAITPLTINTAPIRRTDVTCSLSNRAPKYVPTNVANSRIGAT